MYRQLAQIYLVILKLEIIIVFELEQGLKFTKNYFITSENNLKQTISIMT